MMTMQHCGGGGVGGGGWGLETYQVDAGTLL